MTGAPPGGAGQSGFLEFFVLEAGEYIEQLDHLVGQASASGSADGATMQRVARALRGTATMAKIPAFAEIASGIERVGRALLASSMRWDPAIAGVLVAAVDDLKILVRAARTWGPAEEQRAATRSAELARYAPVVSVTPAPSATPQSTPTSYLAGEASNVAAGLELLAARAGDAETAANVLRRVRALRGIAGVKEVAPLADALEAIEDAARGLEHGDELSAEGRQLLEASGGYLRTLARGIRGDGGTDVNAPSAARDAFTAALENWSNRATQSEQVVPISQLFYDDGNGVVRPSPNPPTSSNERFRIELVSLGEHLRQVVNGARAAHDTGSTVRARRDLKRAVLDAQSTAQSFGEPDIAAFIETHVESAEHIDFLGLAALDDLADALASPGAGGARIKSHASELADRRDLAASIATGLGADLPAPEVAAPAPPLIPRAVSPLAIATPVFTPAIAAAMAAPLALVPSVATPVAAVAAIPTPVAPIPAVTTHALDNASASLINDSIAALENTPASLIDSTIAALDSLNDVPFVEPTPLPDEVLVSIDTLVYRGRAALDRALELRDEMKHTGSQPDATAIAELFDLIELARAG